MASGDAAILRPYQRALASDQHPFVSLIKARRVGGSFGVAHKSALRAMGIRVMPDGHLADSAEGGIHQKLISASQDQSSELLAEVFAHVEAIAKVHPDRSCWPVGDPSKTRFRLRSGVSIRAYPDNPRTARGGQGDITLDEFAFMRDQLKMWNAVKAIADPNLRNPAGYRLTLCTTPFAEGSLAHEICVGDGSARDRFRHFSRYRIDIYSAVRRGFPDPSWDEEQRARYIARLRDEAGDPDAFAQEYECSWLAANATYFPLDLLTARRYDAEDLPSEAVRSALYAGVDVGRKRHLTAIARVVKVGDTLWAMTLPAGTHVLENVPYDVQEDAIARAIDREGALRLCIDATGIGSAPAERLAARFPGRVESVTFTPAVKEEMATTTRMLLEQGRLRIPFDRDLIYDMAKIRKVVTSAGNVRYDADESGGSHADRAWALMLAVHAASRPVMQPSGAAGPRARNPEEMSGLYG